MPDGNEFSEIVAYNAMVFSNTFINVRATNVCFSLLYDLDKSFIHTKEKGKGHIKTIPNFPKNQEIKKEERKNKSQPTPPMATAAKRMTAFILYQPANAYCAQKQNRIK
ncbi:MAG: hypothetical protein J7K00_03005 [Candidatus Diapherotrites archaeon]|nr:hypothetical protein [Candidatus Diapherotrites archaeon]